MLRLCRTSRRRSRPSIFPSGSPSPPDPLSWEHSRSRRDGHRRLCAGLGTAHGAGLGGGHRAGRWRGDDLVADGRGGAAGGVRAGVRPVEGGRGRCIWLGWGYTRCSRRNGAGSPPPTEARLRRARRSLAISASGRCISRQSCLRRLRPAIHRRARKLRGAGGAVDGDILRRRGRVRYGVGVGGLLRAGIFLAALRRAVVETGERGDADRGGRGHGGGAALEAEA